MHGSFYRLGVLFVDVLVLRALLLGVYIWAPHVFGNYHIRLVGTITADKEPMRDYPGPSGLNGYTSHGQYSGSA